MKRTPTTAIIQGIFVFYNLPGREKPVREYLFKLSNAGDPSPVMPLWLLLSLLLMLHARRVKDGDATKIDMEPDYDDEGTEEASKDGKRKSPTTLPFYGLQLISGVVRHVAGWDL